MSPRPKPKATIYAVAQRAGVSISTVSLAINSPHRVSEATRQRVLEAARTEGYRGSSRAAGTVRPSRRMIAVAAPFSSWPSYYERLSGILERCGAAGVDVTVHDLPASERSTAPILQALPVRDDVSGIIVMGVPLSTKAQADLEQNGPPTVVVDAESDLPSIVTDDEHAGRLIGQHLLSLGHTSVLFAHEGQVSDSYVSAGMQRGHGLSATLSANGGSATAWQIDADTDVAALLASTGATAIAAVNDPVAARVLGELERAGLRVPDDVSLTGCDGGDLATALGLTTVVQPFTDSGRSAADLLLEMLDGKGPRVRRVVLGTHLQDGATTRARQASA